MTSTAAAETEQTEQPEDVPANERQHPEEATTSGRTEDGTPAAPSAKKVCDNCQSMQISDFDQAWIPGRSVAPV